MSLVHLPQAIWQDVLINWLGDIKEIVRVDCAYAIRKQRADSLITVYEEKAFPFSDGAYCPREVAMTRFCAWMRTKKVFINNLEFLAAAILPMPLLEDLFSWSAETMKGLSMKYNSLKSEDCFICASNHLTRLHRLKLSGTNAPHAGTTARLLENNSDTLVSVLFVGFTASLFSNNTYIPVLTKLQVLQCPYFQYSDAYDFLRPCPNLTALSLTGNGCASGTLLSAIADCCPLLQRLKLDGIEGLDDEQLLQLARACPSIEYLGLTDCYHRFTGSFANVVLALPRLHTLVVTALPDTALTIIANGGAPSLRVLDIWMGLTYDRLRSHIAALPLLTALSVLSIVGETDCTNLFEQCGHLEILHIRGCHQSEYIANTALLSVATYCPNLHTLVLGHLVPYSQQSIGLVLESCPKLRRLQIMDECGNPREYNSDPSLVFSERYADLAEWLPAGAE